MKTPLTWQRIVVWPVGGLILGLLMASVMTVSKMHDAVTASKGLSLTYELAHLPAAGLLFVWKWLGLPPYGDLGFMLLPYAVVAQWFLFGILAAIVVWIRRRAVCMQ